ncbi:hypothetical protein GUY60_18470, partial [Streptomyces sp. YC537]|nr:hypothetical protein [Streptomyces boluensis]
ESSPWFQAAPPQAVPYEGGYDPTYDREPDPAYAHEHDRESDPAFPVPAGPGRTRPLTIPGPRAEARPEDEAEPLDELGPDAGGAPTPYDLPEDISREEAYFGAFRKYVSEYGDMPNARQLGNYLLDLYGVTGQTGGPLSESTLRPYVREFRGRYQEELDAGAEHIA